MEKAVGVVLHFDVDMAGLGQLLRWLAVPYRMLPSFPMANSPSHTIILGRHAL